MSHAGINPSADFEVHVTDGSTDLTLTKEITGVGCTRLPKGVAFISAGAYTFVKKNGDSETINATAGLVLPICPVTLDASASGTSLEFVVMY